MTNFSNYYAEFDTVNSPKGIGEFNRNRGTPSSEIPTSNNKFSNNHFLNTGNSFYNPNAISTNGSSFNKAMNNSNSFNGNGTDLYKNKFLTKMNKE